MNLIKLNDILRISELDRVKIRLNLSNNSFNALELYHENKELLLIGNFHNSSQKRWFKENDIVIGLAQINSRDWLLIDVSLITKSYNKFWDGKTQSNVNTFYEHEKIEILEKYFGRLIVQFHKKNAFVTLKGNRIDEFILKQILPDQLDNDIFPGYENVNISWKELRRVIDKDTWKTALRNQKGVYLITDVSNGFRYVGKASGEYMLLGRWQSYINSGHGGNLDLMNLDFEHIKENFRFSILDIYKASTNDQIINDRETYWKKTLLSRKFGYNKN